MKLLQKILSHGLLIAFIVAAFFLYTNRAELFPGWFGGAGNKAAAVTSKPQPAAEENRVSRPRPERVISKQPVQPPPAETSQPQAPADPGAAGDAPAARQYEDATPGAGDDAAAAAGAAAQPGDIRQPPVPAEGEQPVQAPGAAAPTEAVETADTAASPAPAAVNGSSETDTAAAPVVDGSSETDTATASVDGSRAADTAEVPAAPALEQELQRARAFYWRQDVDAAATLYQSLIQAYPQNADVWGETGNFYYSLQKNEQATDAYSHAFDLLVNQGHRQRAMQLLDVISRLDEDKAHALTTRLQQSGD